MTVTSFHPSAVGALNLFSTRMTSKDVSRCKRRSPHKRSSQVAYNKAYLATSNTRRNSPWYLASAFSQILFAFFTPGSTIFSALQSFFKHACSEIFTGDPKRNQNVATVPGIRPSAATASRSCFRLETGKRGAVPTRTATRTAPRLQSFVYTLSLRLLMPESAGCIFMSDPTLASKASSCGPTSTVTCSLFIIVSNLPWGHKICLRVFCAPFAFSSNSSMDAALGWNRSPALGPEDRPM
mmetsp:Transcript_30324/g.78350  ORF Transcript_30324/g.78350 Transcript_30324/m.78350 type:complete len:239 (+) Transcript_30324:504-1220(+)